MRICSCRNIFIQRRGDSVFGRDQREDAGGTIVIRFTIPYPQTKKGKSDFCRRFGLNAYYAGKHPQVRRKDAQELHQLAILSMHRARVKQDIIQYPVEVRFYWNDGLDADNHSVMGKAFLDAMKGYIIKDDRRKWVRKVSHEFWEGQEILVEVLPYEKH